MTGKTSMTVNSVLPLCARAARIAAGGGLAVSAQEFPAGKMDAPDNRQVGGSESGRLDFIMPHAAESRIASSLSVPHPSIRRTPFPSENPT